MSSANESSPKVEREHIAQTDFLSCIPWGATTGFQFCSCGNWHQYTLEPVDSDKAKAVKP